MFSNNNSDRHHYELEQLYTDLNVCFSKNLFEIVKSNSEARVIIRERVQKRLNNLKIEVISPDAFLDKYNWEDGEIWFG